MCSICGGSGFIETQKEIDGIMYDFAEMCECQKKEIEAQRQERYIQNSGLEYVLEKMTFDSYKAETKAQQTIKDKASKYLEDLKDWWYISSKPGTGKTHITTAICGELIKRGIPVHYMQWRQESTELKALITDSTKYTARLKRLQSIKVLYIDDFFKGKVSEADKDLAFTIINSRYSQGKITLFSSERSIDDLARIDKAIAGRIKEKAGEYALFIQSIPDRRLGE